MARKFYTIMVVAHARAPFRKFHLSRDWLLVGASLAAVTMVGALLLPHYFLLSRTQAGTLQDLRQENGALRAANERYDQDLSLLRSRVAEFEQKASKFAVVAGVTDIPGGELPSGSPGEMPADFGAGEVRPDYLDEEIAILMGRSQTLGESFRILDEAYTQHAVRMVTTPSIAPARGILGSGFGYRRDPFTGEREYHQGLDLVANSGTTVVAPADGVVTQSGRLGSYGKAVFLSHGNGVATRYAHLSDVAVRPGQRVKRGELLGKVGASGRAMGFHLHYEVLVHNRKVDPMQYILDENHIF